MLSARAGAGAGLLLAAGAVLLLSVGAVLLLTAGAVVPVRTAGALRAGGATGVVAMTRTSGSFVVLELSLELEASCAATVPGTIAGVAQAAQSSPQDAGQMTDFLARPSKLIRMWEPHHGPNLKFTPARTMFSLKVTMEPAALRQ